MRNPVIIILVIIAIAATLLAGIHAGNSLPSHLPGICQKDAFRDSRELAEYLRSFGTRAVVVSILVMVVQTMFTPIPLFLVAGANGYIFGIIWGSLVTLTGAMLGSTIAFYLARFLARNYITSRLGRYISNVQTMNQAGPRAVFLARLVPFIPSSVISYAAGLSKMSFAGFFLASILGKLPEIIVYTALGHSLDRAESLLSKLTVVLLIVSVVVFSWHKKKRSG
ncbi:MAG: TVP38/TMEM64 family protein [Bacillota bacterium]|uniref:TVP38/TMEM64 family protein n=1 Tax=Desulfurispora thermophila TaxID=265470 RepID=UPI0003A6717C|nr:TVP38/TMEM64 family protein [Desulfurispora thermophila]